jgi:hypothetical protein
VSLPAVTSPQYSKAMALGFKLEYSDTDRYWSTFDLMCKYVTEILVPYFVRQKERMGVRADQECILQLDVWSVHRSVTFRTWLDQNYSWLVYLFVLASCTSIAQPCDVGIQRPLKLAMKQVQHVDIFDKTVLLLDSGVDPTELRLDTKIATL